MAIRPDPISPLASYAMRCRVLEFSSIVSPTGEGAIGREVAMKRLISAVCFLSAFGIGAAWAQPFTPNDAGVTMGHWHLNSANAEANKKIFVAMGGTDTSIGPSQRVTFPGVIVIMNLGAPGPAPTAGSRGSVVNHVDRKSTR